MFLDEITFDAWKENADPLLEEISLKEKETEIITPEQLSTPKDCVISTDVDAPDKKQVFRLGLLTTIILGIFIILFLLTCSDTIQWMTVELLEKLSTLPTFWSAMLLPILCGISLVFLAPGTPWNLAAGYLYGIYGGLIIAMAGLMFGASLAFALGRTIAREWVEKKIAERPQFRVIIWAIKKNGIKITTLARLSPLFPFPVLNYAFAITEVTWMQYEIGTAIGLLPATIAWTFVGTTMHNLTTIWVGIDESDPRGLIWMIGGAVMTIFSVVVITILTQLEIKKATKEFEKSQGKDPDFTTQLTC